MTLDIPPRFYQATWFIALEVLVPLALIGIAYMWRIRSVSHAVRLQSEARQEERERIARELHDTLLQAIYGIMLRFQAVAAAIPKDDPLQEGIQGTLKVASDFIVEGRDRVRELRTDITSLGKLAAAMEELARLLEKASAVNMTTDFRIVDQEVDPAAGEDLLAICRESLVNAFRHANAEHISLRLVSVRQVLTLEVTDDGSGMAADAGCNRAEAGHWGIAGMRERAAGFGATLTLRSTPEGTTVALAVPLRCLRRRAPRAAHSNAGG